MIGILASAIAIAIAIAAATIHPQSPFYLGLVFSSRYRSETFRAPGHGLSGNIVKFLMTKVNEATSDHVVSEFLDVQQGHTVVEIGPGSGYAIRTILKADPAKIIGVEISPSFRKELASTYADETQRGTLEIVADDAAVFMKASLQNESIDRIIAVNVIYFLNPIDTYMHEFYRVLKPGGIIVFAVKEAAKKNTPLVFVNVDWDECVNAMTRAGFKAEKSSQQLKGVNGYIPLIGIR